MIKLLPNTFSKKEREFYGAYLRDAAAVDNKHAKFQKRFQEFLEKYSDLDTPVGREEILRLESKARKGDSQLADYLKRIEVLEALLAPADALLAFLQTQHGQHPKAAAAKLLDNWGSRVPNINPSEFKALIPEIGNATSNLIAGKMRLCAEALAQGAYEEALRTILDWNKQVMENRKAAPWVRIGKKGLLDVRYRETDHLLPAGDELPDLWRNSYFIDSLKGIIKQLKG